MMLVTAVLFLIASSPPSDYRPYRLTQAERKRAANLFTSKHGQELFNKVMNPEPFSHTISESDLNMCLAALDEIAFLMPGKGKAAEVLTAMDKAGLADPVVKMSDGVLTLMAVTKKAKKVISLDLAFVFEDDEHMRVVLKGVRVGRMPVPELILGRSLKTLRQAADRQQKNLKNREIVPQDLDAMLAGVLAAMGEESVPTTICFHKKRWRKIRDVRITDGQLRIDMIPILPGEKTATH